MSSMNRNPQRQHNSSREIQNKENSIPPCYSASYLMQSHKPGCLFLSHTQGNPHPGASGKSRSLARKVKKISLSL